MNICNLTVRHFDLFPSTCPHTNYLYPLYSADDPEDSGASMSETEYAVSIVESPVGQVGSRGTRSQRQRLVVPAGDAAYGRSGSASSSSSSSSSMANTRAPPPPRSSSDASSMAPPAGVPRLSHGALATIQETPPVSGTQEPPTTTGSSAGASL